MMANDDLGFVCKACGRFFADSEVKEWRTVWEDGDDEPRLKALVLRCPICGAQESYAPDEAVFRGAQRPNNQLYFLFSKAELGGRGFLRAFYRIVESEAGARRLKG